MSKPSNVPYDILAAIQTQALRRIQYEDDKKIFECIASIPYVPVPVRKIGRIKSMYLEIAKYIHELLDSTRMALGKKILGKLLDKAFYEEYGDRDDY